MCLLQKTDSVFFSYSHKYQKVHNGYGFVVRMTLNSTKDWKVHSQILIPSLLGFVVVCLFVFIKYTSQVPYAGTVGEWLKLNKIYYLYSSSFLIP